MDSYRMLSRFGQHDQRSQLWFGLCQFSFGSSSVRCSCQVRVKFSQTVNAGQTYQIRCSVKC
ncbi:hypothetical protein Hanom_Chr10g00930931 [Helianthus anomalus]